MVICHLNSSYDLQDGKKHNLVLDSGFVLPIEAQSHFIPKDGIDPLFEDKLDHIDDLATLKALIVSVSVIYEF